jgi:preprotein translocase subunit SecY
MERITRYITLGLAALQGFGYTFGLFKDYLTYNDILSKIVIVMILVAGACITMWLGEKINEHGVGNGISMLIFAGIVSRIPTAITNTFKSLKEAGWAFLATKTVAEDGTVTRTIGVLTVLLFVLFALAVIVGIIIITEGTRKVPVQYAKRVVGRKMYGGQSTHIPIKLNASGVLPLIFASAIMQFPETILQFISSKAATWWSDNLGSGTWWYIAINALLILGFTFFYSSITFNPKEMAENIQNNGGLIPGIRQGKATVDYITRINHRITLFGAIFLAVLALVPNIVYKLFGVQLAFAGSSLLIAVSVAVETARTLESQLLMRHYRGFLK